MKQFHLGQVLLLAMPLTDSTPGKKRPALVVVDTGDEDIIVARVTSEPANTAFDVELADWREAGLLLPSVVRVHKVATLEKRLVDCALGTLTPGDLERVCTRIRQLFKGPVIPRDGAILGCS